jgi:acyl carrier protein
MTLVDWLVERVARYLAMSPEAVDTDRTFGDYGLDSAFALSLCTDLESDLGILVDPTFPWDFPSIDAIAGALSENIGRTA